jgi:hypothetical protein
MTPFHINLLEISRSLLSIVTLAPPVINIFKPVAVMMISVSSVFPDYVLISDAVTVEIISVTTSTFPLFENVEEIAVGADAKSLLPGIVRGLEIRIVGNGRRELLLGVSLDGFACEVGEGLAEFEDEGKEEELPAD